MGTTWMAGVLMATAFIWAAASVSRTRQGEGSGSRDRRRVAGGPEEAVQPARSWRNYWGQRRRQFWSSRKSRKPASGIGGQYGEGALLKKGTAVAYYKTTGASVGLQAGAQKYGYAMFFMNAKALDEFVNASGFEVGVGPSVVLVDEGMAKTTTTSTMKDDIYAFVFGQKGLMAGLGIQGNKITKITPK